MQAADETHRAVYPGSQASPGAYVNEAEVTSHLEMAVAAEAAAATAKAYRAASEAVACWGRSLGCLADAVNMAAAAAEGLTENGHVISAGAHAQVRLGAGGGRVGWDARLLALAPP